MPQASAGQIRSVRRVEYGGTFPVAERSPAQGRDVGHELIETRIDEIDKLELEYRSLAVGSQAAGDTEHDVVRQLAQPRKVMVRHGEERTRPEEGRVHSGSGARAHHERDEGPGGELEEQELDGKNDRCQWGTKGCSHARCRTAGKQNLAFAWRHANHLAEQGADRTSRHDDWTLGAEGSSGTNRDGGRQGLGQGRAGGDPALACEHGLHRLGDAVATDDRCPLRHHCHHESAGHGHEDDQRAAMEVGKRGQLPADAVKEGQVGQQGDQVNEHVGRCPPRNADEGRPQSADDLHGACAELSDRKLEA